MSNMKSILKYSSVALATVLVMQVFVPGAFATIRISNSKTRYWESEDTSGDPIVEVVELSSGQVQSLIDKTSNITIDGFGDKSEYENYQNYDKAGVSTISGAERMSDQYIVTNEGKVVRPYDVTKHAMADPEKGYLSKVVVDGFVSYTTAINRNLRVCAGREADECERGYLSDKEEKELQEKIEKAREKSENLDPEEPGPLDSFSEWVLDNLGGTGEGGFQDKNPESPPNVIQSNYTSTHIQHYDDLLIFPKHLSEFIGTLHQMRPLETGYGVVALVGMAIAFADAGSTLKNAPKLASKGISALADDGISAVGKFAAGKASGFKSFAKGAKAKTLVKMDIWDDLDAAKYMLKGSDYTRDATSALKGGLDAGNDDVINQLVKNSDEVQGITKTDDGLWALEIKPKGLNKYTIYEESPDAVVDFLELEKGLDAADAASDASSITTDLGKHGEILDSLDEASKYDDPEVLWEDMDDVDSLKGWLKAEHPDSLSEIDDVLKATGDYGLYAEKVGGAIGGSGSIGTAIKSGVSAGVLRFGAGFARWSQFNLYLWKGTQAFFIAVQPWLGERGRGFNLFEMEVRATPKRVIKQEESLDSYFEIIRSTEYLQGKGWYPAGVFENMQEWFVPNLKDMLTEKSDVQYIRSKIRENPGPGRIIALDQEGSVPEKIGGMGKNVILPVNLHGEEKWMISSQTPEKSNYYSFEHPRSYKVPGNGKRYTSLTFMVKRLDIGGLAQMKPKGDYTTKPYGNLVEMTPSTPALIGSSIFAGASGGMLGAASGLGQYGQYATLGLTGVFIAPKAWQTLTEDAAEKGYDPTYTEVVDIDEAYSRGNLCENKIEDTTASIKGAYALMATTKTLEIGTDGAGIAVAASSYAATGPVGLTVAAAQIGAAIGNYFAEKEYEREKKEGLREMKNCTETVHFGLGWSALTEPENRSQNILDEVKSQIGGSTNFNPMDSIGLGSVSQETKASLENFAAGTMISTPSLKGIIKGSSHTRLYGSELYQIHFDRDSQLDWFLNQAQDISFCTQTQGGAYRCMRKEGYSLLTNESTPIIKDAPQARGLRWDNERGILTIPQKVINIRNSTDQEELMEINPGIPDEVKFEKQQVKRTVEDLAETTRTKTLLGGLQMIRTDQAVIWNNNQETVVMFTERTGEEYGKNEIIRFPDSKIQVYRNNEIEIQDEDGDNKLGETLKVDVDGFISFDNGKLIPGRGEKEVKVNGENVTRNFDEWNHLMIYNLMDFDADDANWGGEGVTDEDGNITALKNLLGSKLNKKLSEIEDLNFSEIDGEGKGSITKEGDEIIINTPDGEKHERNTGNTEIDIQEGPNGEVQAQAYNSNTGEKIGDPINMENVDGTDTSGEKEDSFWDNQRASDLTNDMQFSQFEGADGERIWIDNGKLYVQREGMDEPKVYKIDKIAENGDILLENGKKMRVRKGENGQPLMELLNKRGQVTSSTPLLRAWGKGGMMEYKDGKISISNEFPFKLNPQFSQRGAGMQNPGMMTPKQSPWGSREQPVPQEELGAEKGKPGIAAQLPSTPTQPATLAIFIITILGGIIAIRRRKELQEKLNN